MKYQLGLLLTLLTWRVGTLYCEYLDAEMSLYKDPYLSGRLPNEIMRACRLVVDTGMHAFGWSRQQAVDFMVENTGNAM